MLARVDVCWMKVKVSSKVTPRILREETPFIVPIAVLQVRRLVLLCRPRMVRTSDLFGAKEALLLSAQSLRVFAMS